MILNSDESLEPFKERILQLLQNNSFSADFSSLMEVSQFLFNLLCQAKNAHNCTVTHVALLKVKEDNDSRKHAGS